MDSQEELCTALIPVADRLISAVHALDADAVHQALDDATRIAGGDERGADRALVVILAGMCSEDHAPEAALGWTRDPDTYRQHRSRTDALTASLRAGRSTERAT